MLVMRPWPSRTKSMPTPEEWVMPAVVIENVAEAERLHSAGEFFRRRQHVFHRIIGVGQFSQIHENGAGNVASFIFRLRIPSGIRQKFGGVDDAQVRCTQFVREPVGGYQQFHYVLL